VREVTLLGQTVEAYGKDLEASSSGSRPDLADLFATIHDTPGLQRIRFLTSYPRDMTEPIVRAVADLPKVCEHFNIPVQAADNDVLARMRRGYTIEEYLEWVHRIRDTVPGASLSTDVIVGFCGETEAQFQRTLDLLTDIRFDKVHVAAYSPRPGTIASRHMEDDVPMEEKMRRLHAVEALQVGIATEINQALVGTTQEVLVEGLSQSRNGEHVGAVRKPPTLTGRTRGNKLVHWQRPSGQDEAAPGDLVNVRITRASPWALRGVQAQAAVPA
jgi:tRNA-2-methylthio-N6-dimethylallyladenosine synthase